MKKQALVLFAVMVTLFTKAQVPQALNYQAVARNTSGQIVPSQPVGVRFTITDANGSNVFYQETHNTTTNNFGLFTLAIGKGTAISGTMTAIDWSTGDKYLKVEIAPQGGLVYTLQGTTQLLSVPYALFSEKTKLLGGNAITITNGNTISANYVAGNAISITGNSIAANYQAGNGITINGNTISSNVNPWLLLGNAGTTASNFLGTTDNQPLRIRTNNLSRVTVDAGTPSPSGNVGTVSISEFGNIATFPGQLAVFGRDIPGISMNMHLFNSVAGMNWAPQGGSNNTMGRLFRISQYTSNDITLGEFYDFGIDQGKSFFISEHGIQNQGPNFFKKMITISPQDFVGINFNWGENPTANFHTKGSIRFESISTNNTLNRLVAMDANGNVASRDASSLLQWQPDANGIHYSIGSVAVGTNSRSDAPFAIAGTSATPWIADITSSYDWQSAVNLKNTTSNAWFQFVVGGSGNTFPTYGVGPGNFGIVRALAGGSSTIPIIITQNDFVGISNNNGGSNFEPKARLHIMNGDVYIDQVGSGVIMKSPNGQCWRMSVSNAGTPVFTAIPCP